MNSDSDELQRKQQQEEFLTDLARVTCLDWGLDPDKYFPREEDEAPKAD